MTTADRKFLLLLGLCLWGAATLLYRTAGPLFFEVPAAVYWLNVIVTAVLLCALFWGVMQLRRIERQSWVTGALCLAVPGMVGEVPILYSFSEAMVSLHPETAGRYGAFLFFGYASLILFAAFHASQLGRADYSDTSS